MKRFIPVLLVALLFLLPVLTVRAGEEGGSVDLEVEVIEPPPEDDGGGRGGGQPPTYSIETNLFGSEESFKTNSKGEVQETVEATSEDGNLTITIPEGTIALGEDGKRLRDLSILLNEDPPPPPEDSSIIGLAYDFRPTGATFDPPILFTWSYDPEDFPEGVTDLVLAYYDEEIGEWIELISIVDPITHTITALVPHFTTFALIGQVTPVPPLPPVDKEDEEPEELIEPEESEEPTEPEEPEVAEPVKPEEPDEPDELVVVEEPSEWTLLDSILVGTLVVTLALLLWYGGRRLLRNA